MPLERARVHGSGIVLEHPGAVGGAGVAGGARGVGAGVGGRRRNAVASSRGGAWGGLDVFCGKVQLGVGLVRMAWGDRLGTLTQAYIDTHQY